MQGPTFEPGTAPDVEEFLGDRLLMLPVVAYGKSGQILLDVLVRGLHEGEAAAERSFAASFRSWRAVSACL
jgi:hypothetical protein